MIIDPPKITTVAKALQSISVFKIKLLSASLPLDEDVDVRAITATQHDEWYYVSAEDYQSLNEYVTVSGGDLMKVTERQETRLHAEVCDSDINVDTIVAQDILDRATSLKNEMQRSLRALEAVDVAKSSLAHSATMFSGMMVTYSILKAIWELVAPLRHGDMRIPSFVFQGLTFVSILVFLMFTGFAIKLLKDIQDSIDVLTDYVPDTMKANLVAIKSFVSVAVASALVLLAIVWKAGRLDRNPWVNELIPYALTTVASSTFLTYELVSGKSTGTVITANVFMIVASTLGMYRAIINRKRRDLLTWKSVVSHLRVTLRPTPYPSFLQLGVDPVQPKALN